MKKFAVGHTVYIAGKEPQRVIRPAHNVANLSRHLLHGGIGIIFRIKLIAPAVPIQGYLPPLHKIRSLCRRKMGTDNIVLGITCRKHRRIMHRCRGKSGRGRIVKHFSGPRHNHNRLWCWRAWNPAQGDNKRNRETHVSFHFLPPTYYFNKRI